MTGPKPHAGVKRLEGYAGGAPEGGLPGGSHRLHANESPFGMSEAVREAAASVLGRGNWYGDEFGGDLCASLGERLGLDKGRFMVGSGSAALLATLARGYLAVGDEGLRTRHGFVVYRNAILSSGARDVSAPERDLKVDVDELLGKVTDKTKVVFVSNPGNPTGTWMTGEELRRLHAGLPGDVLLAVDEAYGEYAEGGGGAEGYESALRWSEGTDNVVVLRTFSKAYGMAGMRVGWCYAPVGVVGAMRRVAGPYATSWPSLAGAEAALGEGEAMKRGVDMVCERRERICEELSALGLGGRRSATNFVLAEFGSEKEATAMKGRLREAGIYVRGLVDYEIDWGLRVTVGSEEANELFLGILRS